MRKHEYELEHEREILLIEKKDFNEIIEKQESNLKKLSIESGKKLETIETREEKIAEQSDILEKNKKRFYEEVGIILSIIKYNINKEYLKNEQRKTITLHPVSFSGQPVMESGFST